MPSNDPGSVRKAAFPESWDFLFLNDFEQFRIFELQLLNRLTTWLACSSRNETMETFVPCPAEVLCLGPSCFLNNFEQFRIFEQQFSNNISNRSENVGTAEWACGACTFSDKSVQGGGPPKSAVPFS